MGAATSSERTNVRRPAPSCVGLLSSECSFREGIHSVIVAEMGVEPTYLTPTETYAGDMLIVAEVELTKLCPSVERVRRAGYAGPLLAGATDQTPTAIERAVAAGADDFVPVPQRLAELPYRAMAMVRHRSGFWYRQTTETSDELLLDPNRRTATLDGHTVVLTMREFRLLQYLRSRPKVWITATELLLGVCEYSVQQDSTLVRVHISSLRKKMGKLRMLLESRRTYGYRWIGSTSD